MNNNAANSLLKSLEEPSPNTVIILVTSRVNQLLATIKSRCQLININTPNEEVALDWVNQQEIDSDHEVDNSYLFEISNGKPLKLLELTAEDIDSRSAFLNDLNSTINLQQSVTEVAKKWEKYDVEKLLNWQLSLLQISIKQSMSKLERKNISNQNNAETVTNNNNENTNNEEKTHKSRGVSFLSNLHPKISQEASNLTIHLTENECWQVYQSLLKQKQYIHTSVNSLMFVENMIMLWVKDK